MSRRLATPPCFYRVNDPRSRKLGYEVRIGWTKAKAGQHNKPKRKKYFGDATHGGQDAALAAAKVWAKEQRR